MGWWRKRRKRSPARVGGPMSAAAMRSAFAVEDGNELHQAYLATMRGFRERAVELATAEQLTPEQRSFECGRVRMAADLEEHVLATVEEARAAKAGAR
jgi:hypothetical protein